MEEYRNGKESKVEILERLMAAVDSNQDGHISGDEFVDFCTNMSPNFKEDDSFYKFMLESWGLY